MTPSLHVNWENFPREQARFQKLPHIMAGRSLCSRKKCFTSSVWASVLYSTSSMLQGSTGEILHTNFRKHTLRRSSVVCVLGVLGVACLVCIVCFFGAGINTDYFQAFGRWQTKHNNFFQTLFFFAELRKCRRNPPTWKKHAKLKKH